MNNNTEVGCMSVGWLLIIFGPIISIVSGVNGLGEAFAIAGTIFSIVFGTLLIGIGEIIRLLSKMVNKNDLLENKIAQEIEQDNS